MAIDALVKPLLGLELLRGLRPTQISEIARRAERMTYRPGDAIIAENAPGDAAVVLVSGEALRVAGPGLNGRPEAVPTGALLGEMAMLIETEYSSTVVARTAVRALRLTRAGLHAQMAEDAELAEHFVLAIAGRLRHLALELREVETCLSDAASTGEVGGEPPQLPHVLTVARELAAGVQLLPAFSCCSREGALKKRKRPTPGGEVGRYGAFARGAGREAGAPGGVFG